jgi:hypothetical protein
MPLRQKMALWLVMAACLLRVRGSMPLDLIADGLARLADRVWP